MFASAVSKPTAASFPSQVTPRRWREAILDATGKRPAPLLGIWRRASSTNELAKVVALDAGAVGCAGSVLIAESQTHGKGRFGRTWVSPPGGLYLSVLVEPPVLAGGDPAYPLTLLPLAAGVAVAQAVRRVAGVPAALRWPNDLDWEDRKVAGILAEVGFRRDCPYLAVVGFGVNLTPVSLSGTGDRKVSRPPPPSAARPPGWLPDVDRVELAHALVTSWQHSINALEEDPGSLRAAWESLSPTARGCRCEVRLGGPRGVLGKTDGLAPEGGLRVRTDGGTVRVVTASEALRILHGPSGGSCRDSQLPSPGC